MADATKDDGVLFKKRILGIDLEYTKTDAAIDTALVAAGTVVPGVGNAAGAALGAARAGVWMVLKGVARSAFKSAATEGAEVVAKTALKEGAEATAKAAVKEGTKEAAEAAAKKGAVEWVAPELSKETAEFAAKKAAERTAREAAEAAAKTGAKEGAEAAAKKAGTVAKEEFGTVRAWTEANLKNNSMAGRLEALAGRGPKADAMTDQLLSRAKGLSGKELESTWLHVRNSRNLSDDVVQKIAEIHEKNSRFFTGGFHSALGRVSHVLRYPGETAARVAASPLTLSYSLLSHVARNHTGKALGLGAVAATYFGVDAMASSEKTPADKQAAPTGAQQKPTVGASPAQTEREVPLAETAARKATDLAIAVSKLTAASALAGALNFVSKVPGLGTMALNGARGSAQSLISEIADGEQDVGKAWEKSQAKLQQILPGVHLNALGEFVKGKGVEDMSEEARAHVSDALTALTQPGSEKARAFRATAVAEAKEKAEAAARLAGLGGAVGGGGSGSGDADGEDAEDDGISDYVKNYLAGMMGISPDKLNAANVARVGKDMVQDLSRQVGPEGAAIAAGVGILAGVNASGGKARKAVVGTISTIATLMLLPLFGPLLAMLMPMAKEFFGGFAAKLGQRFDPQTTTGRFNTESQGIVQRDRDPSATTPAPKAPAQEAAPASGAATAAADKKPATTGEDGIMALLRQNGHDVTQSGTAPAAPAVRGPAQRLEQAVPA